MSTEPMPEEVVRFLRTEIDSVRQLETLLALRMAGGARSAQALGAQLRIGPRWTEQQLEDLRTRGLLEATEDASGNPAYRFAPRSAELGRIVDAVAELFDRRRATVIHLIFADADQDALRSLSDAFRLRREEK